MVPLDHNFLNHLGCNTLPSQHEARSAVPPGDALATCASRSALTPQGEPMPPALPAPSSSRCRTCSDCLPTGLIQVPPRHPAPPWTPTWLLLGAHSSACDPACNLQLEESPRQVRVAWAESMWHLPSSEFTGRHLLCAGKSNDFSLWTAQTRSSLFASYPEKQPVVSQQKPGALLKKLAWLGQLRGNVMLILHTSKDFLWLTRVWTV